MQVPSHTVVGLRGERLRGGALANRQADAHEVGDVLAQIPAAPAPVGDQPPHLLGQTTHGRVAARG